MNIRSLRFRLVLWYALGLAAAFLITSGLIYVGLSKYLERNLAVNQTRRADRIRALALRPNISTEHMLVEEISAIFAPEATSRFVRLRRPDGTVVYQSKAPLDHSFDPDRISLGPLAVGVRREQLMDGDGMVLATAEADRGASLHLFVETGESLAPALEELNRLYTLLTFGFGAVSTLALGGGYFLVRRALKPVEEITRSAERITYRNLSERLPTPSTGDEFEHLSKTLNGMITRLDEAFQYNRRFLADASHELRTPLTVLRGELEILIQESCLTADFRERLGSTLEEVERLTHIVEGLFALARLDAGEAQAEWARFDLAHLAASTADQMVLLAEDKNIRITVAAVPGIWVEGNRARWKQVVVNLLDNAIKYTPEGGAIGLNVTERDGQATLEVTDTGLGIPAAALPHIFERFYRVDTARSRDLGGAGLGLSIVKSICTAHGARLDAQSTPGAGSRFQIQLPVAQPTTENFA